MPDKRPATSDQGRETPKDQRLSCQGIIFDFDGVLIDSNATYEKQWKIWADARGVDFEHIRKVHHGIPPVRTIGIVAPHLDAVREAQQFIDGASADLEGVFPIDGALRLVKSVPEGRWAIATSSFRKIVMPRLAFLGLPEPAVLITSDEISRGKPFPDPYLKAAERLGMEASECIVIEDAPAGIESAKTAGARVIAVTTTHNRDELGEADMIVERLGDITVEHQSHVMNVIVKPLTASSFARS